MSLATFILALYVFLQSCIYLAFITIDAKLLGVVGMAFVVVVIIEAVRGPVFGRRS